MDVIDKYNAYYFSQHPRAKKKQIEHPYHPSINVWSIKPRIQMNALKQTWKQFIMWWIKGFLVDDDREHLHSLTIRCHVDKDNPRTEINIIEKK